MISIYVLSFIASYVFIALKAFQQLNVVHHKILWVIPTSLAMAVAEVYIVVAIVKVGWGWVVLAIGLGGGLGAITSMYIHKVIR